MGMVKSNLGLRTVITISWVTLDSGFSPQLLQNDSDRWFQEAVKLIPESEIAQITGAVSKRRLINT